MVVKINHNPQILKFKRTRNYIMKKIIVANWKMNPQKLAEAKKIVGETCRVVNKTKYEIIILPPAVYFPDVVDICKSKKIKFGVQNIFWQESGAFTGEISAKMVKNLGADFVLIGHSERRRFFGEGFDGVRRKIKSALSEGLVPIVCIGTHSAILEANEAIGGLGDKNISQLIFAYEPVWAIGSGHPDTPEHAALTIQNIKQRIPKLRKSKFLYGGSIDEKNAKLFLSQEGIDGLLIGRESLDAKHFAKIIRPF